VVKVVFEDLIEPALKLFGLALIAALVGMGFGWGWHVAKQRAEHK